ncbi:azurocidin isoform X2 [Callithrix jacchus]
MDCLWGGVQPPGSCRGAQGGPVSSWARVGPIRCNPVPPQRPWGRGTLGALFPWPVRGGARVAVGILVLKGSSPLADIVGGRKARPRQFPFLASIQNEGRHFCGGALIHPRFVMTAASCFRSQNPGIGTVVLGAYDLRRRERRSRQTFSISGMSENGYNPQQNLNDLLLLQLDREANLTSSVAILPLSPPNTRVEAGTRCQVAGWGTQRSGGRLSRFPRVVNVTVTPEDQCRPNNLCTGVLTRRGGVCQGDGGTPLICNGLGHGVASFSMEPCGRGPDFFTPVGPFREWIDGVLNAPTPGPA